MKDLSDSDLKGHLGLASGVLLIVTVILGSGVLVLPGLVFEKIGGDGIYAWIACSLLSAPILTTMIMLGSAYPSAGGVAYYAKLAFGSYVELLVSMLFLGAALLGLPSIAIAGSAYLQMLTGSVVDVHLIAVLLILLAGFFALSGGRTFRSGVKLMGGWSLSLLVGALCVLIVLAIGANGVRFNRPSNFPSIVSQIPLIFFSFTGWEIASHLSADFKNPKRDFGRAMFFAFILVCAVYVGSAALVHIADIKSNFNVPMFQAAAQIAPSAPDWLVPLLGASLISANLFGAVVAVSRLVFYLSKRHFLPASLGCLRNGAPRNSVYCVATSMIIVVACDQIGLLNIETMFSLAGMNFLAIYMISAIALVRLRRGLASWLLASMIVTPAVPVILGAGSSLPYIASTALLASFLNRNNRTELT
ncbi:MAG: amino acid permease [Mesorhizobium sp.]|uniref:APC family permease n=1 Tax=Mesorhizobium sp. TaxID=1871066 RepID=UPI000FE4EA6A|nr:amino acid permease [Mesorhizobium sp.]RWO03370.1 MAG: amino acid permease [Mesorhizobium sp.]RWP94221.1 MAG: amino acid permease [Mesorhizobium sp.]